MVLREIAGDIWHFVGVADRRPGLRAEAARAQAVHDVTHGAAGPGEVDAVVLQSEWRTALRLQLVRAGRGCMDAELVSLER